MREFMLQIRKAGQPVPDTHPWAWTVVQAPNGSEAVAEFLGSKSADHPKELSVHGDIEVWVVPGSTGEYVFTPDGRPRLALIYKARYVPNG